MPCIERVGPRVGFLAFQHRLGEPVRTQPLNERFVQQTSDAATPLSRLHTDLLELPHQRCVDVGELRPSLESEPGVISRPAIQSSAAASRRYISSRLIDAVTPLVSSRQV